MESNEDNFRLPHRNQLHLDEISASPSQSLPTLPPTSLDGLIVFVLLYKLQFGTFGTCIPHVTCFAGNVPLKGSFFKAREP
jgi:hypothetical protein